MLSEKTKSKTKYHHLTEVQRNELFRHLKAGLAVADVAQRLDVHRSTVHREIARNQSPEVKCYLPDTAQKLYQERRKKSGSKIENSKQLQEKIQAGLAMCQSPEVIAGRLKLESGKHKISHESIYKWIYSEAKDLKLYEQLIRKKRKRGFRPCKKASTSKIPNRISIHQRPQIKPGQAGHWEGDTVHLSGGGAIVTIYDKATKIILGAKMTTKTSDETMENLSTIFEYFPSKLRRSITFDNGGEFAGHEHLSNKLHIKTYFCDSYCSWQKGGIENANGILRRFVPKGSKSRDFSAKQIQNIIQLINNTPRKSLKYKTPNEALLTLLKKQEIIIPLYKPFVALQI